MQTKPLDSGAPRGQRTHAGVLATADGRHVRRGPRFALHRALLALCAAAPVAADVPPAERLPTFGNVYPSNIPANTPYFRASVGRRVVLEVTLGDQPYADLDLGGPEIVRWYERGPQGNWIWRGPLEIPGFPALSLNPYGTTAWIRDVNEAGDSVLTAMPNGHTIALALYSGGAWSALPSFEVPGAEIVLNYFTSPTAVVVVTDQAIWRGTREPSGPWQYQSTPRTELGGAAQSDDTFLAVDADHVLRMLPVPWYEQSTDSLRCNWILAGPRGFTVGPAQPKLHERQFRIPRLVIRDGFGIACVRRSDLSTGELCNDTIVGCRWLPDGTLGVTSTHTIPGLDLGMRPVVQLQGRHAVCGDRIWTASDDGAWHPGALVPPRSAPSGEDVIVGDDTAVLRLIPHAHDLDADGVADAVEIDAGTEADCNANRIGDAAEIALGLGADANHDGVPDQCATDCDGNGLADIGELRHGALESCMHPGHLARCDLLAGDPDLDHNGVPDLCDPDRNGNAWADVAEIGEGAALDCDGDWRIDDAPVAMLGRPMAGGGLPLGPGNGVCFLTCFPAGDALRSVDGFRFSITSPTTATCQIDGRPMLAFVAVDPTYDNNPSDARVVWSQVSVHDPDHAHATPSNPLGTLVHLWEYVATPHIPVDAPAVWVGYSFPPRSISYNSLYGCSRLDGKLIATHVASAPSPTCAMVFNSDLPASAEAVVSGFCPPTGAIAAVDIYSRPCRFVGDFDGNGRVDGGDLAWLLGDWGATNASPCDLNHDNRVDAADLAILIAHFGDE